MVKAAMKAASQDVGAVLVTGAGGFLGRAAACALAAAGRSVVAVGRSLARLPAGGPGLLPLEIDLSRPFDPDALPPVSAVLHFAYPADLRGCADGPTIAKVDLTMTAAAAELAARKEARFVMASTGSLYGTAERPFVETDPLTVADDVDGYLPAKLRAEEVARSLVGPERLLILRLFFPYGPGMRRDSLFDRLVNPDRASAPVRLDGEDGILTNPAHVDDVCEAVRRLLERRACGVVNLGGPEILSLREIGDRAAALLGATPRRLSVPARRPPMLAGDLGLLRRLLDWTPPTTLDIGLRRCLAVRSQAHRP